MEKGNPVAAGRNEAISPMNVSFLRSDSKNMENDVADDGVLNVRLSPEQIEEIHTDEFSLKLFYATRIEPLTITDIKREFPEPEPGKAQAVMDRYIKVGLVHLTDKGQYHTNFPDNYINYSHYRYDDSLEARKDGKVFERMKEFNGNKAYWTDKSYFSMDAFYTQEQSLELKEMLKQIKLKAKLFSNENMKSGSVKGLRFRRLKFYDMTFMALFAFLVTLMGIFGNNVASASGGNDPTSYIKQDNLQGLLSVLPSARVLGGGNDPTTLLHHPSLQDAADFSPEREGGGHDPGCFLEIEGQIFHIKSPRICHLKRLIDLSVLCNGSQNSFCVEVDLQIRILLCKIEAEIDEVK